MDACRLDTVAKGNVTLVQKSFCVSEKDRQYAEIVFACTFSPRKVLHYSVGQIRYRIAARRNEHVFSHGYYRKSWRRHRAASAEAGQTRLVRHRAPAANSIQLGLAGKR